MDRPPRYFVRPTFLFWPASSLLGWLAEVQHPRETEEELFESNAYRRASYDDHRRVLTEMVKSRAITLRDAYSKQPCYYVDKDGVPTLAGDLVMDDAIAFCANVGVYIGVKNPDDEPPEPAREISLSLSSDVPRALQRRSYLRMIAVLCKRANVDWKKRGTAADVDRWAQIHGIKISDDTLRKILEEIDGGLKDSESES